jgi:hypothetical protein
MAKALRAERLELIRDLAVLFVRENIKSKKELVAKAITEGILQRQWDASRIFQYVAALHLFSLDSSPRGQDILLPTIGARALASSIDSGYRTAHLSQSDTQILQELVFRSEYVQDRFLKFFSSEHSRFDSVELFKRNAIPVFVIRKYQEEETRPRGVVTRRLCDIENEFHCFERVDATEFLYTIWYWYNSLNLVDRLIVPPDREIVANRSHMIFPIRTYGNEVDVSQFESFLRELWPQPNIVIPLPRLIHIVCRTHLIQVRQVKSLIETLVRMRPDKYYLSRAPEILLGKRMYLSSYMKVDGYWRSELIMRG